MSLRSPISMPVVAHRQRGAALVVALILLMVLTVLGITGMNMASTELVMAGNEQHRSRAFHAAEIGIEQATLNLGTVAAAPGTVVTAAPTDVTGSPVNPITGTATDTYETATAYAGESDLITDFSSKKFIGYHYTVSSTGRSSRGAAQTNVQGVYVINGAGSGGTFQ